MADILENAEADLTPQMRSLINMLEQKSPKLIDHRRAPADQAITDPVDTLQVQTKM